VPPAACRPKLSKRVFLHLYEPGNYPPPLELMRWNLADRFHWTLDVIDALSMSDMHELVQVDDGKGKYKEQHGSKNR
jgi:hypothetical protein